MRRRSSEVLPAPSPPDSKEIKKILYATHFTVFLYATCFWIQIGVMPYLTRKLGVDTTMFGYLQSVFAFVQLCGGPFYGRFGDLFGGKYALILAALSGVSTYGLMTVATSVPLLFLSRLVSVAMHTMQGSQMVITDITSNEERAAGIGRLGISYGVGMVLGPLLGGQITDMFSEQAAALAAMIGSVAMVVIVFIFVPKNLKECSQQGFKKECLTTSDSVFDMNKYISIFRLPNFMYLFIVKAVSSLPIGVFQAMFSVFAMNYFHLNAKENGMVLSFVGVTGMVVQGFCTDSLTKHFSESILIKYSVAVLAVSNFLLIFVTNIYAFIVVLIPLITSGSIFTVIITSLVTKSVSYQDTGAALGLSMAANSFVRTISPMLGGILYSMFGFPVFGLLGLLVNGLLTCYLFCYGRDSF